MTANKEHSITQYISVNLKITHCNIAGRPGQHFRIKDHLTIWRIFRRKTLNNSKLILKPSPIKMKLHTVLAKVLCY